MRATLRVRASLICLLTLSVAFAGEAAIPSLERSALLALFNSTGGPSWSGNGGWGSAVGTECTWSGVTCNEAGTTVTELNLGFNNLVGTLPSQLGQLPNLEVLYLSGNELGGSIPPELGNLPKLRILDLGENDLTGSIPTQLGQLTSLEQLQLHDNALTGAIPSELGNLPNLARLWLYTNRLSGAIPTSITQLAKLEDLQLAYNELTGTIPAQFGTMSALIGLQLNNNQLTGTIPSTLGSSPSLLFLDLSDNQLTGSIPTSLGNLTGLIELKLTQNQLTGTIPSELGRLTNLTILLLSDNDLTGSIPREIGDLVNLTAFWANGNQLTGAIPPELGKLAALRSLLLLGNQLTGAIPAELGQCTSLDSLDLGFNQLTGSIPPSLGNLVLMNYFVLATNQLTGTIPPELSNMTSAIYIDLGSNELTGTIPTGLASSPTLEFLSLEYNQLTGSIPSELGQSPSLQFLSLRGNRLSGTIPPQLGNIATLRALVIGQNQLIGTIPPQLGQLSSLEALQIDFNSLGGPVPSQLLNLTALLDNGSDFGYNALYTNDPTLLAFLDSKEGAPFRDTQTVAVTNPQIAAVKSDTVVLTWQPIAYFNDPGGYAIAVSTTPGGAPVQVVTTPDKQLSSYAVDGLTPQTTYYFVITSVSYPSLLQQNLVISEPTATLSATTTSATISPPLPVVTTYPAGLVASADTAGAEDYYNIRNYGDLPTTLTISQLGDFFTQSPTTATLGPDEELYVEIRGLARPAGAYSGTVLVNGTGFSNTVRIPVKMLSATAQEGTALADATEDRIDVAAPANESPTGSATFTNLGNGTLNGIVVSDVGFIVPQSGLVTIAPGQSVPVSFQIDRTQRPDASALSGTAAGTLSLVYATGGAAGRTFVSNARRGVFDGPGVGVSLVSIVDTVRPTTAPGDVPTLGSGEVALLIPGVGHVRGGVGLFISDVTITNVFGVNTLSDLSMYFSPSMDAPPASKSAPVAPVAPGQGIKLADVVTTVFGGDQVSGTLQIRTRDFDKIYTAANIFNISNPLGTYGSVIPVFRSDRALAAGESLVLTGMRKSATTRTNIFVQETAGGSASVTVRFFAASGVELSSVSGSVTAFRMLRLLDQVPEGTVMARVTNDESSSGRIVAYATPVDQESGDFWSVADWSQLLGANRAETVVIPVAGVLRGANDTFFRTDVSLSNVGTTAATGTLEYIEREGGTFSKPIALGTGESIEHFDVVGSLFGAASGSLGYLVYTPNTGSVAATSRTYATVGTRPGTYGTGVPALPRSSAMRLGQSRQINGLEVSSVATIQSQKPASFRSNIGIVETGGAAAKVRVTASYGDSRSLVYGPIASFELDLPARGFVLLSDLSNRLPATARGEDLLGVSLRFQVVSGNGAVIPFVTSVDNGSGDQVLRTE
ncbi:MAG: leucine-rich repeat domain-containing protein [Thermoanaerobaculia bacterium]